MGRKKIPIKEIECVTSQRTRCFSPDGKLHHFPDQPEIQRVLQRFNRHNEEDRANLQVAEDTINGINIVTGQNHINNQKSPDAARNKMPIQETQAGNEAGMSGSTLPMWLAEAEASRGGEQAQRLGVSFAGMRDSSSSSSLVRPFVPGQDTSQVRGHLPATLPRWLGEAVASRGGLQAQMQGIPLAGLRDPSSSSSSVRPSAPGQDTSEVRGPLPATHPRWLADAVASQGGVQVQRQGVPFAGTRDLSSSSSSVRPSVPDQDTSQVRGLLPAALPRWLAEANMASRGGVQAQMQGVPLAGMRHPSSSSSSVRPSVPQQDTSQVRERSGASVDMVGGHEMRLPAAEQPSSSYTTLPKWRKG